MERLEFRNTYDSCDLRPLGCSKWYLIRESKRGTVAWRERQKFKTLQSKSLCSLEHGEEGRGEIMV